MKNSLLLESILLAYKLRRVFAIDYLWSVLQSPYEKYSIARCALTLGRKLSLTDQFPSNSAILVETDDQLLDDLARLNEIAQLRLSIQLAREEPPGF